MTTITHDDTVDATKNFQPTNDSHIVVEVHVVCTPGDATNSSIVYVNAIQNGYALKKSDTSASVGLSILGSVSVPIRSNSDAMVKVSSETIQSAAFYKRFFELVSHYLSEATRTQPVPTTTGLIEVTPLPPVEAALVSAPAPAAVTTAPPVPVLPGTTMPEPVVVPAMAPAMAPVMAARVAAAASSVMAAAAASAPATPAAPAEAIAPKAVVAVASLGPAASIARTSASIAASGTAGGALAATGPKAIEAVSTTTNAAPAAPALATQ
jgi:hypothetical protein